MTAPATDTPRATMSLLERRTTVAVIAVLLALSGAAWWWTAGRARMEMRMMGPALFLTIWVVMMVAMMFPTVAPFVLAHRMVVRKQGGGWTQTGAFVLGYLAVWSAIGSVPTALFAATGMMDAGRWTGAVLIIAGAYQFTPWKNACLRRCRTPLSFLMTHDFRTGSRGSFLAGIRHGTWCFGCCWALMAVLVAVGMMHMAWMAAIAVVFLLEKNWRRGAGLPIVVGAAIVVLGIAMLVN